MLGPSAINTSMLFCVENSSIILVYINLKQTVCSMGFTKNERGKMMFNTWNNKLLSCLVKVFFVFPAEYNK